MGLGEVTIVPQYKVYAFRRMTIHTYSIIMSVIVVNDKSNAVIWPKF